MKDVSLIERLRLYEVRFSPLDKSKLLSQWFGVQEPVSVPGKFLVVKNTTVHKMYMQVLAFDTDKNTVYYNSRVPTELCIDIPLRKA